MITQSKKSDVALKESSQQEYDAFLSHLGPKSLASVTRHMEICEADAALGYGRCWRRLASTLGTLAPHATEAMGNQVLKFYTPDGKYRKQVFALADARDGFIHVYLPDVIAAAVARKIIKPVTADTESYQVVGDADAQVELAILDADTQNVAPFCRPMLGWGRRALRTTLTPQAGEGQVRTLERLCKLAAEAWANATPAPAPAVAAR